ncbi:hypothetical protein CYR55_22830, partial [Chimaeribacter californicus]
MHEVINDGFNHLIGQLNYALSRVKGDDLSGRYITNCIDGMHTLAQELAEVANADADSLDGAVEALENKRMANGLLQHQLNEFKEKLALSDARLEGLDAEIADAVEQAVHKLELLVSDLEAKLDQAKLEMQSKDNMLATYAERDKRMTARLRELELMEPEKQKAKKVQYQNEARELRASVKELSQALNADRLQRLKLKSDNTLMLSQLEQARTRNDELARHIERANGLAEGYRYETKSADGTPVHFYLHRFFTGVRVERDHAQRPRYVNNLDFSLQIRSSIGISCDAKVNEWGRPHYYIIPLLKDIWPEDIYEELQVIYRDELKAVNPLLVARMEWAESVRIEDIQGLRPAILAALQADDYKTLRDVVMLDVDELEKTKGLGKK